MVKCSAKELFSSGKINENMKEDKLKIYLKIFEESLKFNQLYFIHFKYKNDIVFMKTKCKFFNPIADGLFKGCSRLGWGWGGKEAAPP